jgi:hypothetical protein
MLGVRIKQLYRHPGASDRINHNAKERLIANLGTARTHRRAENAVKAAAPRCKKGRAKDWTFFRAREPTATPGVLIEVPFDLANVKSN